MEFLEQVHFHNVRWYHSSDPLSVDERELLSKKFGLLQHHANSTEKGKTPRPKIVVNKMYTYFVFHIPFKPKNSQKFAVCDLNVFVKGNTLITISSQGKLPSLEKYFEKTKSNSGTLSRRLKKGAPNLMLNLMAFIWADLEETLDQQGEQVDSLNEVIFHPLAAKQTIAKFSLLRYNQIVAVNAVERQGRLLENFVGPQAPLAAFRTTYDHKWNSLVETVQTLAYELHSDSGHLEGLVKTFETLVTHRTNETVKLLTLFSVLLLPLTLISGIYGMNFRYIPLANHLGGFWLILLGMFGIASAMFGYFKYKKWL